MRAICVLWIIADCITTGDPGLIFDLSMDSVDQGVSCSQHPPFQPRFEVRQRMLAEEHLAPRPLPLTGGARGRDPNHNTAEEEQSYQTPIFPSKGENGKGKRSESKGYRKEYHSPHHRKGEDGLAGIVEDGIGIAAGERGVMTWRRTYEGRALVTFHTSRVE